MIIVVIMTMILILIIVVIIIVRLGSPWACQSSQPPPAAHPKGFRDCRSPTLPKSSGHDHPTFLAMGRPPRKQATPLQYLAVALQPHCTLQETNHPGQEMADPLSGVVKVRWTPKLMQETL